jgi:hypothetical protein
MLSNLACIRLWGHRTCHVDEHNYKLCFPNEFQSLFNFSLQIGLFMINPSTFLHSMFHQEKMKTGIGKVSELRNLQIKTLGHIIHKLRSSIKHENLIHERKNSVLYCNQISCLQFSSQILYDLILNWLHVSILHNLNKVKQC